MASRLEEDLCCSVCSEVFKDPVILSCCHSFCRVCLQSWWREKEIKECPLCKKRHSKGLLPPNLALKNLCETFLQQRGQRASETLCCLHSEKLKLFCLDHQQPVCVICRDSEKHTNHRFRPINEAAPQHKKKEGHGKKISVVVLGSEAALKSALKTIIIGRDEAVKTSVLRKTETHENNTYRVICTPDLNKLSNIEDIREVFAICDPDMSLLVVKEGFSPEEVWEQIEKLHKLTRKPREEFIVLLPLSHKRTGSYPFRCCDLSKLFSDLSRMAEERYLNQHESR